MRTPSISVIIPTHNRKNSLEELLMALAAQKYPMNLVEVVVVADGCVDDTSAMLKNFQAPYSLKFAEQPASGPAKARNKGASMALNDLLLFLDDDIIPSDGLLAAHANGNSGNDTVLIGYLPILVTKKPDLLALQTRSWWEELYYKMQNPGYRFTFKDLLSGNFSLHSNLFRSLGGFDETLRCREDYELGARLIKHGARFIFSREAWGYHNDTLNNLERSLRRKRSEGQADVQFAAIHPDVIRQMPLYSLTRLSRIRRSLLMFLLFQARPLLHVHFFLLKGLFGIAEAFKLRSAFRKINYQLNKYWYFIGVANEIESEKNLRALFKSDANNPSQHKNILEIDLQEGLAVAEQKIDEHCPSVVHLFYGEFPVAKIPYRPEAEKLQGRHLRHILLSEHYTSMVTVVAMDAFLSKQPIVHEQTNPGQALETFIQIKKVS